MAKERKATGPIQRLVRERLQREARALGEQYIKAVRPIIAERNGSAELVGSSVLLHVNGSYFALTAAHVIDEHGKLLIGGDSETFYLPAGLTSVAPNGDRNKDPLDVAIVRLPADLVVAMGAVRFLEVGDLDVDDEGSRGPFYTFVGYPAVNERLDREHHHFDPIATIYSNVILEPRSFPVLFKPATHLGMRYDPAKVIGEDGRIRAIPKQKGVSGGGMWRFDAVKNGSTPNRLAAITIFAQTAGRKAIIGTRISVFLEAIAHGHPELRSQLPQSAFLRVDVDGPR